MELRQLRYFVAVAEERHFGRAAHRLRIATPTLSQQVRALERNLGVVLVDRTRTGPVTLTPGGEVLLRHARVLLSRADRARDEVVSAAEQPEQVLLRVAAGAELQLVAQLRRLTSDPTLGVVALSSSSSDALLAVREESGDAAVVWGWGGAESGLTTAVLQDVVVSLALPVGHRLADRAAVEVADLAEEDIVMFPRQLCPSVWDVLLAHLLPDGPCRPGQVVIESDATNGLGAVLHGVATGQGVGPAVGCRAEQGRGEGVVLRPFASPLTVPLELAWREPASRALRRSVAILRAHSGPAQG